MAGGFDQLFRDFDCGKALLGAAVVVLSIFGAGLGTGWLIWG